MAGEGALATGDIDAGVALLRDFGARSEAAGRRNPARWPWRAVLGPALGQEGGAEIVDTGLERAGRFGAPLPEAQLHRAAARLRGDPERIEEHLRRAVDLAEAAGARYELACALMDLGALLRRTRRRTEARDPLRLALDLAVRAGAQPVAARAREELVATGARPRNVVRTGVESLTPMERRVARLAQAGRTNRKIASELFLTVRTIEMHLTNTYRKLDCNRDGLAGLLGDGPETV